MDGIKTDTQIMERCPTRNAPEEMVFDLRNYLRSNARPQSFSPGAREFEM